MMARNRFLEAFKENGNLAGLCVTVAASAALLSPLPLLAGLVGEAAYLLFVPDSRWYRSRLSQRADADVAQRRQQLKQQTLPLLDKSMQTRYARLEEIRAQIGASAQDDPRWFAEVLHKLDYLLEKFLLFAVKEAEFRHYLLSVWQDECGGARLPSGPQATQQVVEAAQASYAREVAEVERLQAKETDANTKAVLLKRQDVLQQRSEGVGKIGRILTNLTYQLQLLEDTFGLINDQIRARSPEQVLADIEGVVYQTESMTQLLEELAPYEQMAA